MTTLQPALSALDAVSSAKSIFDSVTGLLASLNRALIADRAFQRLSALSDAQLAARGMTRDDVNLTIQRILAG
ncbi:MAG: hypothetical protein VW268_04935 [Rhodospirillaceae bacterium]